MTDREAAVRLRNAVRAALALLRHGHAPVAVTVLEDAEQAVAEGFGDHDGA